jgi:transposase-like protein
VNESHEIQQNPTPVPPRPPSPATLSPEAVPASFSPNQTLAMAALLAGKSITEAARAAGVDRTTIHAWLKKDASFRAFLHSARVELFHQLEQRQLIVASMALRTQERLLRSRKTPAAVKAKVAADVLSRMPLTVEGPQTVESARNVIAGEFHAEATARMKASIFLDDNNPEHRSLLAVINPDKLRPYWQRVRTGREKADPAVAELLRRHFDRDED